jgi:alkanesulfonate monooxygenase SsuD/methylene tetrahydromethanopterin reductase-like flavin-dependent oxidoreductase (luciferase family)
LSVGLILRDVPATDVQDLARAAEAAGCSHLLFPELSILAEGPVTGRDPLVLSSLALGSTRTLRVGTGVAGSIFRPLRHLALAAASLTEQSNGRFVLGIGVAHREFAEQVGVPFPARVLAHAREASEVLRRYARDGVAFGAGFPVWLAALGPGMVSVAVEAADGAILNWVLPETAAEVAERARASGRPWSTAALVRVGRRDDLLRDADRYRTMFRNYAAHFDRQGLGDAAAVVDGTCLAVEDLGRLRAVVEAYTAADVDVLVLNPSGLTRQEIEDLLDHVAGMETR